MPGLVLSGMDRAYSSSCGLLAVLAVHFSNCRMLTSCVVAGGLTLMASGVVAPSSRSSSQACRRNSATAAAIEERHKALGKNCGYSDHEQAQQSFHTLILLNPYRQKK